MTIRDIFIRFGYEVDRTSEQRANDSIQGLKSTASKLLGAIGIGFSIAGLSKLAEAASDVEALKNQFAQVFGDIEQQAGEKLNSIADSTGISVNRMKGSFTQIAAFAKASGMDTEGALNLSDRAMIAVADSAAFYDKSLEQVTESLRSFLKGNFENDAALGLSATETTRNAAANALYGKSFIDLAEDQKQLTLLKMVEDANTLSGAYGQAARESDTWTNQMGNLKQSVKDLMAVTGSSFLKPAIQILKFAAMLVAILTDGIRELTSEGTFINRMFERMSNRISRAQVFVERFIGEVGGAEQALKLLLIAGGSLFTALNAGKILTFLTSMGKLISAANIKLLAIIAGVLIFALLIEDFINFMQGNDSLFGEMLERAGFELDEVRNTVRNVWTNIQNILKTVWANISAVGQKIFGELKKFWDKWGGDISQMLADTFVGLLNIVDGIFSGDWEKVFKNAADIAKSTLGTLSDILGPLAPVIMGVVTALSSFKIASKVVGGISATANVLRAIPNIMTLAGGAVQGFFAALTANPIVLIIALIAGLVVAFIVLWNKSEAFRNFFIGIWESIKSSLAPVIEWLKGAWESLKEAGNVIFGAIATVITDIFNGIKAFWDRWGTTIIQLFIIIFDVIKNYISFVFDMIKTIIETAINIISTIIQFVFNGIQAFWETWGSTIINTFTTAWELIKTAFQAALDIIMGIVSVFVNLFQGNWAEAWEAVKGIFSDAWNGITDIFSTVLDWIIDTFSEMPSKMMEFGKNMIQGFIDGISNMAGAVGDAVNNVMGNVTDFLGFNSPSKEGDGRYIVDWGYNMVAGFLDGVKKADPLIENIMRGVSGELTSDISLSGNGKNDAIRSFALDAQTPRQSTGIPKSDIATLTKAAGNIIADIGQKMNGFISSVKVDGKESGQVGDVVNAIRSFALDAQTPRQETIAANSSSINSRTLTQNVEITNQFNGDRAGQQKSAEAIGKASDDVTGLMSRGLAFVRG